MSSAPSPYAAALAGLILGYCLAYSGCVTPAPGRALAAPTGSGAVCTVNVNVPPALGPTEPPQ